MTIRLEITVTGSQEHTLLMETAYVDKGVVETATYKTGDKIDVYVHGHKQITLSELE